MVSKASEDFPEPDRPVNTTSWSRGMATSIFLRLCSRAPRIVIWRVSLRAGLLLRSAIGPVLGPVTGSVRQKCPPGAAERGAARACRTERSKNDAVLPVRATAIAVENCQQKRPAARPAFLLSLGARAFAQ